jgi:peptidylamidoglycolate lyase
VIYDNGSPPEAGIDPNPNAKAEAEKEDSTRVRVGTSTTTTVPIPTTAQGQGSDANEASTNTTLHFADLLEKELYSVDGTASTNNATANGESPIPGAMTIQEDRRAEVTGNGSTSAQNLDLGTGNIGGGYDGYELAGLDLTKEIYSLVDTPTTPTVWRKSISVPASLAQQPDEYLCTSLPLEREYQTIQTFIPRASTEYVHHMVIYSCPNEPQPRNPMKGVTREGKEVDVWNCKHGGEGICPGNTYGGRNQNIVYAWAKGAERFDTSESDSGFVVGSRAGLNSPYLVLQSHFLTIGSNDTQDEAAEVEMVFSSKYPEKILSVDLFANSIFSLEPNKEEVDVQTKCCLKGSGSADLFAYRVHAHNYARNISLAIANESIVAGDPQLPNSFTKVEDSDRVKLNFETDWTVTCAYNTQGTDRAISVGQSNEDEMCNMYLMLSSHVPYYGMCSQGQPVYNYPDCMLSQEKEINNERLTMKGELALPGLGQVAGLHLGYRGKASHLLIFHRAGREMERDDHSEKIEENVFIVYDTKKNNVVSTFGNNTFKLPHGLTIDRERNIWTTDVDSQLSHKLDPTGGTVLFTVGTDSERGHDAEHLCRPTEVAVANGGDFFVSDGYCNSRVVKYGAGGERLGEFTLSDALIPHSIILDDCSSLLYVADREHSRIMIVDAHEGKEVLSLDLQEWGLVYSITRDEYGNIYALTWDRVVKGNVHIVQLQLQPYKAYLEFDLAPVRLPEIYFPHDFAVTYSFEEHALHVYVGETGPGPSGKVSFFTLALN